MFQAVYKNQQSLLRVLLKEVTAKASSSQNGCFSQGRNGDYKWRFFAGVSTKTFLDTQSTSTGAAQSEVEAAVKVATLIERFRHRGHFCAQLDPLNRVSRGPWLSSNPHRHSRLNPTSILDKSPCLEHQRGLYKIYSMDTPIPPVLRQEQGTLLGS